MKALYLGRRPIAQTLYRLCMLNDLTQTQRAELDQKTEAQPTLNQTQPNGKLAGMALFWVYTTWGSTICAAL